MDASGLEDAVAAIVGLVVGSFLNVIAWRLPRGESIVAPGSHCPSCEVAIAPYDNVPVVSWLVLRGHCRSCRAPISVRYPLIELITGGLFAAVAVQQETSLVLAPGAVFMAVMVVVAAIDLEHRIVPNRILAPAVVLALGSWAIADVSRLPENLLAGAVAAGVFGLISEASLRILGREGMGMGDVKLAGVMGLFLGADVAPALLVAVAAGAIVGVFLAALSGPQTDRRSFSIPFVPYMALGGVVGWFWGDDLVNWYLRVSGLS